MADKGNLSTMEGFTCGALAACLAVTLSNPAEVAKTRLQLQGELAKGGEKVYKNAIDVFAKTWRNEGIRGMQRGLGLAYAYQVRWYPFTLDRTENYKWSHADSPERVTSRFL